MPPMNKNNAAVKRIMQEAKELANDPCTDYTAAPLEDDIFEWHCTIRGPSDTEFEGGLYHFRILLPAEYPFRPPSIMMLTPNGRFELNTKICISFTNYHEELWQPAWGVRTAIIGLQGFFPLKGQAAVGVGSIEYPASERKRLAALSRDWVCPHCQQPNVEILPDPPSEEVGSSTGSSSDVQQRDSSSSTADPPAENHNSHGSAENQPLSAPEVAPASRYAEEEPIIAHEVSPLMPSSAPAMSNPATPSPAFIARATHESGPDSSQHVPHQQHVPAQRNSHKPPLLLDTAICVLLVLAFALVCRRIL
ncbi:hypothetical protein HGRIS_013277 [Hohenbuehelia grisea]|uniref:UBC core domain-containing protein n=1 Tax=Hohenbuehelia grisea TaxID=104357 RepID=A0ABR3IUY4_9AGAR